jgi:hypothetical protein
MMLLEKGKTGGGIGYTSSWGVDSTQELKNSMEESRNANGGSWVTFMMVLERREVGNERNGEGVCSVQGGYTRKNWIVRFIKLDNSIFARQLRLPSEYSSLLRRSKKI